MTEGPGSSAIRSSFFCTPLCLLVSASSRFKSNVAGKVTVGKVRMHSAARMSASFQCNERFTPSTARIYLEVLRCTLGFVPCDPALDGFAQLLDLPLSDGLHLRGVSAEVSRDRSHHCLHNSYKARMFAGTTARSYACTKWQLPEASRPPTLKKCSDSRRPWG